MENSPQSDAYYGASLQPGASRIRNAGIRSAAWIARQLWWVPSQLFDRLLQSTPSRCKAGKQLLRSHLYLPLRPGQRWQADVKLGQKQLPAARILSLVSQLFGWIATLDFWRPWQVRDSRRLCPHKRLLWSGIGRLFRLEQYTRIHFQLHYACQYVR